MAVDGFTYLSALGGILRLPPVCRKCAVRFAPLVRPIRFFLIPTKKCFRVGLIKRKSLI
jgi:hypothetical protein